MSLLEAASVTLPQAGYAPVLVESACSAHPEAQFSCWNVTTKENAVDLSKIVKKNIAGKSYYTDDKSYYTEYKILPTDTGLMQIARDRLRDEKRFAQILRLNNGKAEEISNKNMVGSDWTLLLPTASPFS